MRGNEPRAFIDSSDKPIGDDIETIRLDCEIMRKYVATCTLMFRGILSAYDLAPEQYAEPYRSHGYGITNNRNE